MTSLRPQKFSEILGQDKVKETLLIAINSAKIRQAPLAHTLIDANAGCGKTTFCYAIGNELDVPVKTLLGPNIRSLKHLVPTLLEMKDNEVLFIDEIHRMNIKIYESLYTVLEDFRIDLPVENAEGKFDNVSFDLVKFTMLGATTEAGALPVPFRDRFKLKFTLTLYSADILAKLIEMNCDKLEVPLSQDAVTALAEASRGTPRIANGLLEWVRDYRISKGLKVVSRDDLRASLTMRDIGEDGSTQNDRRYLKFLKKQKSPIGVGTIASSLNMNIDTIETVVEPWLLSRGKIIKTSRGRIAL